MSVARQECLKQLQEVSGCRLVLVTPENLGDYLVDGAPLHPAYQYLLATHRADYLRTYFMHHHGGGYSDIKRTEGSWVASFEALRESPSHWICGYPEVPGGVAISAGVTADAWGHLVGNCAYICRPRSPLTVEWYGAMMALLDDKQSELEAHPAAGPQDCKEISGYPIEWNEMLGRIFHRVCNRYRERLMRCLPIPVFVGYR